MVAILAVAMQGDPAGLIAGGACGGRPPMVHRLRHVEAGYEWLLDWHEVGAVAGDTDSALPLWWDGKLVPAGWDQAWRLLRDHSGISMPYDPEDIHVNFLCEQLVRVGLAFRIARLACVNGRLVEIG